MRDLAAKVGVAVFVLIVVGFLLWVFLAVALQTLGMPVQT